MESTENKVVLDFNNVWENKFDAGKSKFGNLLISTFVLISIFSLASLRQVEGMSSEATNLYNHPFTVSNAANNIKYHIISIQRFMNEILLAENKQQVTIATNLIKEHEKKVIIEFEIVFDQYLGDRATVDTSYQYFLRWQPMRQMILNLASDNKLSAAKLLNHNENEIYVEKLIQDISGLTQFAHNKAALFINKANTYNFEAILIIVFNGVITFAAITYLYIRFKVNYFKGTEHINNTLNLSKKILNSSPDAMVIVNEKGEVNLVNAKAIDFFGYAKSDYVNLNINQLIPNRYKGHDQLVRHAFKRPSCSDRPMSATNGLGYFALKKSGEEVAVEVSLSFAELNGNKCAITTIRDVSDRKKIENKVFHQANYDFLTNTPNRFLSMERLSQFILDAARKKTKVAVLFIDFDDFKKINDTLGHSVGDQMLILAANRLKSAIREEDTLGRLGGDEFIILMKDFESSVDVVSAAKKLIQLFNQSFQCNQHELVLTASVGISIYPDDGNKSDELLRFADIAMYSAKENGRNQFSFFNYKMQTALHERLAIEHELSNALEQDELYLVYQPKYNLVTDQLLGFEVLLRWENKKLGSVSPTQFIPIMESMGIINVVGMFVLNKALSTLKTWQISFDSNLHVAVNFSPLQFTNANLHYEILGKLKQHHLLNKSLEVEITEGLLLKGSPHVHHMFTTF